MPAEPLRPDTLCLHISCKFEFDLVGWSPGGLLAAFEIVAGSERSLMRGAVWSRRGAGCVCGGRRPGGKRKEKYGGNKGEHPDRRGTSRASLLGAAPSTMQRGPHLMAGTRDPLWPAVAQPVPRSQKTRARPHLSASFTEDVHGAQHPQPDSETPSLQAAETEQALVTQARQ